MELELIDYSQGNQGGKMQSGEKKIGFEGHEIH